MVSSTSTYPCCTILVYDLMDNRRAGIDDGNFCGQIRVGGAVHAKRTYDKTKGNKKFYDDADVLWIWIIFSMLPRRGTLI